MGKKRGRPKTDSPKDTIFARIAPATVQALDEIAATMSPKPSRSQLIDVACAEYVERHGKKRSPPKESP